MRQPFVQIFPAALLKTIRQLIKGFETFLFKAIAQLRLSGEPFVEVLPAAPFKTLCELGGVGQFSRARGGDRKGREGDRRQSSKEAFQGFYS